MTEKVYLTELQAIDPTDGAIKTFVGPRIMARSEDHAREIVLKNMPYCVVIGALKEEGPEVIEWIKFSKN